MIRPPARSITRFFVPLIDVLILLFCIFLLMPFVSKEGSSPDPEGTDPSTAKSPEELRQELEQLKYQMLQLTAENDRLVAAAANPANRMSVRVLEIDGTTGKLFAFDPESPDPRQEVRDQADAQRLIDQERRTSKGKDIFFLILYPRKRSGFPEQPQVEAYRRWFASVPHGFDNPWGTVR
jgi:hypothetical protein